jgi:hypothetical protein
MASVRSLPCLRASAGAGRPRCKIAVSSSATSRPTYCFMAVPHRLLMLAWGGFPTPYKPAWRAAACPSHRFRTRSPITPSPSLFQGLRATQIAVDVTWSFPRTLWRFPIAVVTGAAVEACDVDLSAACLTLRRSWTDHQERYEQARARGAATSAIAWTARRHWRMMVELETLRWNS